MDNRRIFSSVLMSGLVIAAVMLPDIFFVLCLSLIIALGLNELFYLFRQSSLMDNNKFPGIIIGALIPVFHYWSRGRAESYLGPAVTLIIFIFFICQVFRRDKHRAVMNLAVVVLGVFYIAFNLSFLVKIKMMPSGALLVFYLLLTAKSGDIGAYYIGSFFGRHRLIPRISPKKSIEGAVGGLIVSVAASMFSGFLFPGSVFVERGFLGLALGVLAQTGDLTESLIKRDCQVKDSGVFVPGLGGMLDIVDSLIFVVPVFYYYLALLR